MKPSYCPVCGGRVGIQPAGLGPCGEIPETLIDMRTMQPHDCDADDVKAMARLYDFARRAPTPDEQEPAR